MSSYFKLQFELGLIIVKISVSIERQIFVINIFAVYSWDIEFERQISCPNETGVVYHCQ